MCIDAFPFPFNSFHVHLLIPDLSFSGSVIITIRLPGANQVVPLCL